MKINAVKDNVVVQAVTKEDVSLPNSTIALPGDSNYIQTLYRVVNAGGKSTVVSGQLVLCDEYSVQEVPSELNGPYGESYGLVKEENILAIVEE